MKKNLDGVFSMDYDFVKVLHPCKSVAHLVSWILNIYIYWEFGVGNTHINTAGLRGKILKSLTFTNYYVVFGRKGGLRTNMFVNAKYEKYTSTF